MIEAKREHREPPVALAAEPTGQVLDLMAALTESVAKAKASRGESGDADVHELPKKKAAKKTVKKTAVKKTAAKKAAVKRATKRGA